MKKYLTILFALITGMAHAQPSFLDSTFGTNGIVLTHMGSATSNGSFSSILMLPDNKIAATGTAVGQAIVIRYNENGTIDSFYAVNGVFTMPNVSINSIILQPDNKIVTVGSIDTGSNESCLTMRLNTDGSLDNTFGIGGMAVTNFSADDNWGYNITLQTDNKILITGQVNETYVSIARLQPNGVPDSSFGINGSIVTSYAGQTNGIAVMSDSRIVIGCEASSPVAFMAMRCLSDGSFDTSFNHTGVAINNAGDGGFNYCRGMQLQPDNKIVLAGSGSFGAGGSDFTLLRYNTDGSLDRSFGDTGIANIDFNGNDDNASALYLTSNGKFIVVGYAIVITNENFALTRINSNGSIDNTFGNNGKITTAIQSNNDRAYAVTIQLDSKIVCAGYSWIGSYPDNYRELTIARYIANPSTQVQQVINVPEDLALYPNPTSGNLNIKGSISHIISVTACDILGNQIPVNIDLPDHKIFTSDIASGIYFFKISTDDNPPDVQKIIIQN